MKVLVNPRNNRKRIKESQFQPFKFNERKLDTLHRVHRDNETKNNRKANFGDLKKFNMYNDYWMEVM